PLLAAPPIYRVAALDLLPYRISLTRRHPEPIGGVDGQVVDPDSVQHERALRAVGELRPDGRGPRVLRNDPIVDHEGQPALRPNPHLTVAVLDDGGHSRAGQSLASGTLGRKVVAEVIGRVGRGAIRIQHKQPDHAGEICAGYNGDPLLPE